MDKEKELILDAFKANFSLYKEFCDKLEELISTILKENEVKIEAITNRPKDIESLKKKLLIPDKRYSDIQDVPDLAGLRVIVYHLDDVTKIANIIRNEFDVDEIESVDKSKNLEPHEFGYLSIHLIIRLSDKRVNLSEWKKFKTLHAELQIRTVLQHAWATISHSMLYKNKDEVPKIFERRLNRIAAIFELADQEFDDLINENFKLKSSNNDKQILQILQHTPGTNLHSYDWIRNRTELDLSNEAFDELVKNNPELLIKKNVKYTDGNGERKRKPGLRFKRKEDITN